MFRFTDTAKTNCPVASCDWATSEPLDRALPLIDEHMVLTHPETIWARKVVARSAEAAPLWGDKGPEVGQIITVAGSTVQMRWTGTHWEMLD